MFQGILSFGYGDISIDFKIGKDGEGSVLLYNIEPMEIGEKMNDETMVESLLTMPIRKNVAEDIIKCILEEEAINRMIRVNNIILDFSTAGDDSLEVVRKAFACYLDSK